MVYVNEYVIRKAAPIPVGTRVRGYIAHELDSMKGGGHSFTAMYDKTANSTCKRCKHSHEDDAF